MPKRLEDALHLWGAADERLLPEAVLRVFKELDEHVQEPPGVGSRDDQPLRNDTGDLLLDHFVHGPLQREQMEQDPTKEIRVTVGVAKLVGHGSEKVEAPLVVEPRAQLGENFDGGVGDPLRAAEGRLHRAHSAIEHDAADDWDVPLSALGWGTCAQLGNERGAKPRGLALREEGVNLIFRDRERLLCAALDRAGSRVGNRIRAHGLRHLRRLAHLWQLLNGDLLGCVRIREANGAGEGRQYDVAQLDPT